MHRSVPPILLRTFSFVVLGVALILVATACSETTAFSGDNIAWLDFNPRLRPDLAPLAGGQVVMPGAPGYTSYAEPRMFGAGGPTGDSLLTRGFPTFPGTTRDAGLVGLGNAACFWTTANDRAVLGWEVYAKLIPKAPDEPACVAYKDLAGACTGSNPFDRSSIQLTDGTVIVLDTESAHSLGRTPGVVVSRHTHPRNREPNRFDYCVNALPPIETVATDVEPPCAPDPETGGVGMCNPGGCSYNVQEDTTFAAVATFAGKSSIPRVFGPHWKIVGGGRVMSRRLAFAGRSSWSWTVPTLADGRLEENFSPNVNIGALRVFELMPDGRAVYVIPSRVSLNGASACAVSTSPPDFDVYKACTAANGSLLASTPRTPAYQVSDPGRSLTTWSFELPASAGPTDAMYVEYTLRDATRAVPAIAMTPPVLDLGRVQRNLSATENLFVENTGTVSVTIQRLISGSPDVVVRPAAGATLPLVLRPRDVLSLDLVATARTNAVSADVIVTATNGLSVTSRVRFQVIDGPLADAFPALLGFTYHNPGRNDLGRYRKLALVTNSGALDMHLTGAHVDSAVAGLWSFEVSGVSVMAWPAITIPPGGSETLVLTYHPPATLAYGSYNGTLVIETDGVNVAGGELRMPLVGWYWR